MNIEEKIRQFEEYIFNRNQILNEEYVQGDIYDRMRYYKTPAVSMAVINDYQIEWVKAYGTIANNTDEKVDENTVFQAASISKSVFALAVMRLVEQGIIDLDEDVNKYLTSWKVPSNGKWQPKITLRQLLSHTAGVNVQGFDGYNIKDKIPNTVQILNGDFSANTDAIRVKYIPGLQFNYSGGGYTIAQQVVVDVLNKPFPQIINELIFEPLEMNYSTYERSTIYKKSLKKACGHNGGMIDGGYCIHPEEAAAGLWTTPSDLAKLGIKLQQILNGESNDFIRKASLEEMIHSQSVEFMGLGFFLDGEGKTASFSHNGTNTGYESRMFFYKQDGKGLVVMINSQEPGFIDEINRAIAYVYNWPQFISSKSSFIDIQGIDSLTGKYISNNKVINICNENEVLFIIPEGQMPIELIKETEYSFFSRQVNICVEFTFNDSGHVNKLNINQNGQVSEFLRI